MMQFDKDGDGKLSKDELPERMAGMLERGDTNKDGFLSREELVALARSQILMIPGGFSAGDEPDGSGKFIAAVFKSPIVRDATMELLKSRDGLILGREPAGEAGSFPRAGS